MKKNQILKITFAFAYIISIFGVLSKINHWAFHDGILLIVLLATFVYIAIGIYEVNQSKKLQSIDKIFWTLSFIFLSFIAGFYYYAFKRNHIF